MRRYIDRGSGLSLAQLQRMSGRGWASSMDRRGFVRSMAGASAMLLMPLDRQQRNLRIAVVERRDSARTNRATFTDGVMLGYSEARRSASLFGKGTIELLNDPHVADALVSDATGSTLSRSGVHVILAALDDSGTRSAAAACDRARVVLFNGGARGDSLRREICSPFVFHIEASDAMYSDASKAAPGADEVVLWSAALEKYGAAQLNDRFRSTAHRPMNGPAWAGWCAVKIAWESFLRSGATDAPSLASHMSSDAAQFDGHKGAPLSFRKWDRQLRQTLYALERRSGRQRIAVRDVPDLGRSSAPVRELLDSLGDDASHSRCGK